MAIGFGLAIAQNRNLNLDQSHQLSAALVLRVVANRKKNLPIVQLRGAVPVLQEVSPAQLRRVVPVDPVAHPAVNRLVNLVIVGTGLEAGHADKV